MNLEHHMAISICNMLYVKDVATIVDFWKQIGFVEIGRQQIMDSETVIIAPTPVSDAKLQIWDIEFIRRVSPEVADNKPSMLFVVSDIEAWHGRLKAATDSTSAFMDNGGKRAFNFADPENNYFAFGEE
jgi:predicted enzyme related to lactoylglutathione lyase